MTFRATADNFQYARDRGVTIVSERDINLAAVSIAREVAEANDNVMSVSLSESREYKDGKGHDAVVDALKARASPHPIAVEGDAALPSGHTRYSNQSLADLFVRLTHDLEWGGRRPNLVRYEAPVSVGISGPGALPIATAASVRSSVYSSALSAISASASLRLK